MAKKNGLENWTWNVRSFYRTKVLGLVTSEIEKNWMDHVGVQEVRWEGSGSLETGNYTLFLGEGNAYHQLENEFFVHRQIGSAIKRVEFVSNRVSYLTLKA